MIVYRDADEWYPVYTLDKEKPAYWTEAVEVDDALWKKYVRLTNQFRALQDELGDLKKLDIDA